MQFPDSHCGQLNHCAAPPPRCIYARYLNAATYPRHTDMPAILTLLSTHQIQICQIPGCCGVPNRYRYARYLCCSVPNRYRYTRYLDAAAYLTDTDIPDTYAATYPTDTDKPDTYAVAYPRDTDVPDTWMLQHTQQIQIWHIPGCCSVLNRYRYGTYLDAATYSTDTDTELVNDMKL